MIRIPGKESALLVWEVKSSAAMFEVSSVSREIESWLG